MRMRTQEKPAQSPNCGDNVQEYACFAIVMNRRTLKGQRKIKVPVMKMSGKKKEKVQKDAQDSCDTPGCGCGN
tara:strand:+ start:766 stop:984 length:219 start_codon:yes stop_codon:yes gene_type:complete